MKTIHLHLIHHRGRACIAISFAYDAQLKEKVKALAGVRWSATHTTFYIEKKANTLHMLFKQLKTTGVYIDYSQLSGKSSEVPIKRMVKQVRTLSASNKEVIRDFVSYLKGLRLSESTVKTYVTFVSDFIAYIGKKPLDALDNTDVRLFVEYQVMHRNYAISTHRQLISALKQFANFCPNNSIVGEALPRPSKSSYLPTVLSQAEVIDLLRFTKNLKHRTVLALLYSAGLRVGEAIALELRDIDIDRRQLLIRQAKGRKDRVVVLAKSFIPLFQNYLNTYMPETYFIEGPNATQYTAGSIRNFLRKSCKAAKISKRVTPHSLRHSFATHLVENGVNLRHIQELLGHAKPETTMIYTHVARKDIMNIHSPLDTALLALRDRDKNNTSARLSDNLGG